LAWPPRGAFRYAWAYATAAIVVLAAGVWFVQTRRQPSIDQLIASAYSERRPFELRIAGAAYGPVRQERSGERSALAEPTDLLKAEYLIKEQLATRPNDQAMLVASAFKLELEAFHDFVVSGKAPLTSAEDAIHDLALCEAIIRFIEDRQPIADPSAIPALASTN
jgi:hypothetical protein